MPLVADARRTFEQLHGDGRGWILLAVSVGNLLSIGVRVAFPALLPGIRAEFLLTNATAGLLLSVLWMSFASAQLPGGVLSDRLGERTTVVASMVLSTVALVLITFSPGFPVFVAGLVVLGLATGLYGTPRITILSDIYPDRTATAISVHSAFGNLGNATFPVVATVVAGWFAWRAGIGVALPGFVLVTVALWLILPARTSPGTDRDPDESRGQAVRRVLRGVANRPALVATAMMVCLGFVWQGFTAFLPTYLVDVKGLSERVAGLALGAFFVSGGLVQPVAGTLADQYGQRRILAGVATATAVALTGYRFVDSAVALVGLSVLAGLQLAFWPIVFAYVPRTLPSEVQGSGFGVLRTLFLVLGALGPVVVGTLADRGLFAESLLLLAGISLLTALFSSVLPSVDSSRERPGSEP